MNHSDSFSPSSSFYVTRLASYRTLRDVTIRVVAAPATHVTNWSIEVVARSLRRCARAIVRLDDHHPHRWTDVVSRPRGPHACSNRSQVLLRPRSVASQQPLPGQWKISRRCDWARFARRCALGTWPTAAHIDEVGVFVSWRALDPNVAWRVGEEVTRVVGYVWKRICATAETVQHDVEAIAHPDDRVGSFDLLRGQIAEHFRCCLARAEQRPSVRRYRRASLVRAPCWIRSSCARGSAPAHNQSKREQ